MPSSSQIGGSFVRSFVRPSVRPSVCAFVHPCFRSSIRSPRRCAFNVSSDSEHFIASQLSVSQSAIECVLLFKKLNHHHDWHSFATVVFSDFYDCPGSRRGAARRGAAYVRARAEPNAGSRRSARRTNGNKERYAPQRLDWTSVLLISVISHIEWICSFTHI